LYERHRSAENVDKRGFCEDLVDRRPARIKAPRSAPASPAASAASLPGGSKSEPVLPHRKHDLYENCRMLAPDGELICTCDRKKLKWYIEKGIADLISEDPPTIRLKFTPGGRGHAGDAFYLTPKENRCVACGKVEKLCRHSIIPHLYRKHFPEAVKSRSSHDIVLLCTQCTHRISLLDAQLMDRLAHEYNAPRTGSCAKYSNDPALMRVKTAANALRHQRIPAERRAELLQVLREHLRKDDVTAEEIEALSKVSPRQRNPEYRSHGALVVVHLDNEEKIRQFIIFWRKHFLEKMKPGHMPSYWDLNRDIYHE
jgi:hypothetical protein